LLIHYVISCISVPTRSDDEDDDYGVYQSDSETRHFSQGYEYYSTVNIDEIDHVYGPHNVHPNGDNIDLNSVSSSLLPENFDTKSLEGIRELGKEADEHNNCDSCEAPCDSCEAPCDTEGLDAEPVDFENNGLLWLPPEPEDEEDEREAVLFDDDDDEAATGEWGYLRCSRSFDSGEYRSREKSSEEHRKAMKNVVEDHFRALIAQLLQVENLPVGDGHDTESWLDIILGSCHSS
jgi:1-phosphatidylinositol-3-phosphate 5-kinase